MLPSSLPVPIAWGAKDSFIMFLNEAALGKEHPIKKDDRTLTKPPSGFDSVVAQGQTEPGTYQAHGHTVCQFLLVANGL